MEKVAWLCAMYPEAKPMHKRVEVPSSLLPPGAPPASFSGGTFLTDICNNWLGGKVGTTLSPELMARVAALPWFAAWLEGVEAKRAKRSK